MWYYGCAPTINMHPLEKGAARNINICLQYLLTVLHIKFWNMQYFLSLMHVILMYKAQLESNASTIFLHHTAARRQAGLQRRFYISAVIHVRQYRKQSHKLCTNRVPNRFLSQGRLRKSVFSATCEIYLLDINREFPYLLKWSIAVTSL